MRKSAGNRQASTWRFWLLLAALPLASGAALIVHVLTSISLGVALVGAGIIVTGAGALTWMRLPSMARTEIVQRAKVGLIAGFLATIAYDVSRWLIVTLFHDTFAPFDVFPIFGHAIAGANLSPAVATTIGILYHYTNGLLFAVAYAILLAPRGWWTGILWALGLEAVMLTVYPGWLHPTPFEEFVSVSILGHVAYGSVLGIFCRWLLARQRRTHVPGINLSR
jgi:hypothetical protein